MIDLRCPNCGSENTQRVALVAASGTQTSFSRGGAIGYSRGTGLAAGTARGASYSSSQLASLCSPPIQPRVSSFPLIAAIFFTLVGIGQGAQDRGFDLEKASGSLAIAALFGAITFLISRRHRNNMRDYAVAVGEWRKRYICLRCSHLFAEGNGSVIAAAALSEAPGKIVHIDH